MTLIMGEKKDPFLLSNAVSKIYLASYGLSSVRIQITLGKHVYSFVYCIFQAPNRVYYMVDSQ